MAHRLLLMNHK